MTNQDRKGSLALTEAEYPRPMTVPPLSAREYQLIVENIGEAVAILQDEQIKFFNPKLLDITGYAAADLAAMPLQSFIHPADRELVLARHRQRFKGEVVGVYPFRIITGSGVVKWVETRAIMIDWEGQPASLNFLTDITERKQAEEALKASEKALRIIFNRAHDAILIHSPDGAIIDVNDTMLQMYGVTREEALVLSMVEDYSARDNPIEKLPELWRAVMAGEDQFLSWKARRPKDGSTFEADMFLSRLTLAGQPYIMATVRDITRRLEAEQELQRQSQELETILNTVPAYIFYKDREHRFVRVNTAFARSLNLAPADMIGKKIFDILPDVDEQQVATYYHDDAEVMVSGRPKHGILEPLPSPPGQERWVQTDKVPYRDGEGNIIGIIGLSVDITERRQAEEALRQYAWELQARNEELDAFAYTVAHDLKNPLGVLTNVAEILAADYASLPAEVLPGYLEIIARSGRKANDIIEALLLLCGVRQQAVEPVPLAMERLVAEAQQRLADVIEASGAIITAAPATWPVALGYGPWIEEVWTNYLSNGLKYGGQPPYLDLGAEVQVNGMVRFWVHDNGAGLSAPDQARLFRPFIKLDPDRSEGHGLGLSIVRRIVERLGGEVSVQSDGVPGRGSVFSFTLPAAVAPA